MLPHLDFSILWEVRRPVKVRRPVDSVKEVSILISESADQNQVSLAAFQMLPAKV